MVIFAIIIYMKHSNMIINAGSILKVNSVACLSFLCIKHQMQELLEVAPFMPIAINRNY